MLPDIPVSRRTSSLYSLAATNPTVTLVSVAVADHQQPHDAPEQVSRRRYLSQLESHVAPTPDFKQKLTSTRAMSASGQERTFGDTTRKVCSWR